MGRGLVAFTAGAAFGFGLAQSGGANPVVINAFLDLAGDGFDPTLLILFAAAVVGATTVYQLSFRFRERPLLDRQYHLPIRVDLDRRLIVGALIFGVGWSLSGYCVGPALASATAYQFALPYLGAAAVGVFVHDLWMRWRWGD